MTPLGTSISTNLPTVFGDFRVMVWKSEDANEPVALVTENFDGNKPAMVRIHSECLTGDVFESKKCDCGEQLHNALQKISEFGNGIVIYLRQEGRGIGLYEKIKAYKLQEEGVDTYEANIRLGHQADSRDYSVAVEILNELGVKEVQLLTQNPEKIRHLESAGFQVEKALFESVPNKHNEDYLKAKRKWFKNNS